MVGDVHLLFLFAVFLPGFQWPSQDFLDNLTFLPLMVFFFFARLDLDLGKVLEHIIRDLFFGSGYLGLVQFDKPSFLPRFI